ncbi:hypothetical protein [Burkholderia sp. ABCPW 111]|uniref:hypothetical protein n=1 Tax=Burkholderia sp. ABCPW 111 TaxID=1820025 RepID=UPI000531793C|nr:hypothetical protein [Burkholderia sp. ABCPW 111]KGS08817.1 hypothetical protein X946_216 [Burkholderia sp. ABCPW 111]
MAKLYSPMEVTAFGVKVSRGTKSGSQVVSMLSESVCDNPVGLCATQSAKLYALTMMIHANGFDVFDELLDDDKRSLVWLMNDLAGQVAALAELARDVDAGESQRGIQNG